MDIHLYLMCCQCEALVASHLDAEAFGLHMAIGTQKHTSGNVVFVEIDPSLKSDAFKLNKIAERCAPHADGSPRKSKYISIYRALEHIPLSAFGKMYLTTRDGRVLGLGSKPYNPEAEEPGSNLYTELCPVFPRVASSLPPFRFCRFITNPDNPLHVPRIIFADNLLDREADGSLAGYLPYPNREHIADCIKALGSGENKPTKTIERNPQLIAFYRTIGRGFFAGDQTELKFYPFPSRTELESTHYLWWRSASME
ncbi:MAG: hypothetical protein AB7T27_08660 [Kiritimatiellia bacterium]